MTPDGQHVVSALTPVPLQNRHCAMSEARFRLTPEPWQCSGRRALAKFSWRVIHPGAGYLVTARGVFGNWSTRKLGLGGSARSVPARLSWQRPAFSTDGERRRIGIGRPSSPKTTRRWPSIPTRFMFAMAVAIRQRE